jgi:hypothetical protein
MVSITRALLVAGGTLSLLAFGIVGLQPAGASASRNPGVSANSAKPTVGRGGVSGGEVPHAIPAPTSGQVSHTVVAGPWVAQSTVDPGTSDGELDSVSCLTVAFCMAAGWFDATASADDTTLVEQWNGSSWSLDPSPNNGTGENDLLGISCTSTAFCVAVGYGQVTDSTEDTTLVEQWNGTTWSIVPSPNIGTSYNDLYDVSCTSPTFCMAGGYNDAAQSSSDTTLLEEWNGVSWSVVTSPNIGTGDNDIDRVSCTSPTFCVAVGYGDATSGSDDQTLVLQWNGTTWSLVSSPNVSNDGNDLDGVSCVTNSMCVAVGYSMSAGPELDSNLVEQWNGNQWTMTSVPDAASPYGNGLDSIDCYGPTSCAAGGYSFTESLSSGYEYQNQALTWNGTTWAQSNIPSPSTTTPEAFIGTVSCVGGAMCIAVGGAYVGSSTREQPQALSAPIPRPGYDEVASDGGIFTFGGAGFYGSTGGMKLNKPIVGMAETPDGGGYWLVASDGGIFAFGDAAFYGSTGATPLNKPIVGMASTPDGRGYWLVASDGGIFAFGDAGFFGSQGATPLNKPIVGMASTPDGQGYWLVASDGGIFTHGDAGFFGSQGATALNKPIVGMASTPDGQGYWLVASDGGIFTHGDATYAGSQGGSTLNKPVVGMGA